jgi:hypothetical protein
MRPSRIAGVAALALLALAGCGGDEAPKPPSFAEAFPSLPLPPQGTLVSTAGGAGALQLTMSSPAPSEQVTSYYVSVFSKKPWRLVNQSKRPDGGTVLLAEQNGQPLWVTVRRVGEVTQINLAGAVPAGADSGKTAAKSAAPPKRPS